MFFEDEINITNFWNSNHRRITISGATGGANISNVNAPHIIVDIINSNSYYLNKKSFLISF